MSLLKTFFAIIIMGVVLWFLALNLGQNVQELHLFALTLYDVPVAFVLLFSFLVGVLIGFLIPVMQVFSAKNEMRKYQRKVQSLQKELDELRNVSIEEDLMQLPDSSESQESSTGQSTSFS